MNECKKVASFKSTISWFRYRIRALLALMLLVAIVGTVWQYRNHGTVLVAKRDILLGESLSPQNVTTEQWPIEEIPDGAATQLTELSRQLARSRLYSGEAILQVKLCPPDRFASAPHKLPVVIVLVRDDPELQQVNPGDRVDILAINATSGEGICRTILSDITVFARPGEDSGGVRTLPLWIDPTQTEQMEMLRSTAEVAGPLLIRRIADNQPNSVDAVSMP